MTFLQNCEMVSEKFIQVEPNSYVYCDDDDDGALCW